jgi:hypothetical protein
VIVEKWDTTCKSVINNITAGEKKLFPEYL